MYSKIADTYKEWIFYNDNEAYMTSTRLSLPMYQNTVESGAGMANLFGRYQIQRSCNTFCQEFRFGKKATALTTEYFLVWERIKLLFFASLLYSLTVLVVAFWVNSRLKHMRKTVLGEYCLTITFVVLFILAMINKSFITSTSYTFGNAWEIVWGSLAVVAFLSVIIVAWL